MSSSDVRQVRVIDSHTGGEPTRVVIDGGPDLGGGPLAERVQVFREEYDWFRSAVVNEPRGSDVLVGALLCKPHDERCAAGVIFFNNVGYLGMCGHGTIGVAATLAHLGRIGVGPHRFDTPVGTVRAWVEDAHAVSFENVESYRHAKDLAVDVPGIGFVRGDVAWGGNWFFIVHQGHGQELTLANAGRLTDVASRVRGALVARGISGARGGEIDHVELCGPPASPENHARNFVLCPGGAYDRSPCGTGTSAKLACLAADGKLKPGDVWRQESVTGSVFEGSVRIEGERIFPKIRGRAFVNAEAKLLIDPKDPYRFGIRA
jgi:4-hydroxyproline epimerase